MHVSLLCLDEQKRGEIYIIHSSHSLSSLTKHTILALLQHYLYMQIFPSKHQILCF
jgi:hypothetical protein